MYTFLPHLLRKRFHPKSGRFYAHLCVLGCLQISKFSKFALSLSLILVYQQIIRWYSNNSHFFNKPYTILVSIELCRLLRLRCGRSYADSARGTRPSGLPFPDAAVNACDYRRSCVLLRPANRMVERRGGKFLWVWVYINLESSIDKFIWKYFICRLISILYGAKYVTIKYFSKSANNVIVVRTYYFDFFR